MFGDTEAGDGPAGSLAPDPTDGESAAPPAEPAVPPASEPAVPQPTELTGPDAGTTMTMATDRSPNGYGASESMPGQTETITGLPIAEPVRRRRWPRRWWTWLLILVVVLALAGTGSWVLLRDQGANTAARTAPSPSASAPGPIHPNLIVTRRDAFEALLARRTDAMNDRDQKAFLADLDPTKAKLIRGQKLLFKNLGKLPLESFEYVVRNYQPPTPVDSGNPGGRFNPGTATIEAQVQFADADPRPTAERYFAKVEFKDGKLLIADISNRGTVNPYSPAPWDATDLTVVRTTHMLVGVSPDAKGRAREVANAAERAYETSRGLWPKRSQNEFIIFATGKRSTFESWYGYGNRTPDFSVGRALTVPTCCETKDETLGDSTSTHIILDLHRMPEQIDLEWTIAHELTHAVSQPRADADYDVPTWAVEGYAEYVGIRLLDKRGYFAFWARDVREYVNDGKFRDRLPTDKNFYGKSVAINYALSVRLFEYLAGEYGESTVKNFFFYLNAMDDTDVDAAMKKYFKASEKKVVANWASWVRNS